MNIKIAIDAMGGDNAPEIAIEGLKKAISFYPDVIFKVFGKTEQLEPILRKYEIHSHPNIELIHCSQIIEGNTEARAAIRNLKDSSMRKAIESVAQKESDGVVSAGNTGAYMALSKLILKTLPGIHRPAIISLLPTLNGKGVVMLDLGANAEVSCDVLVQFCFMGQAFARCVQGNKTPSVGLLNIGTEDSKGNSIVKEAHNILQNSNTIPNYHGFIEGDDIFSAKTDVVVADGFTGNIALKTAEGTINFFADILREELSRNIITKFSSLLAKSAFKSLKQRLNPSNYNGAQFLGLQQVSVKSHGGTDGLGFYSAIKVTIDLISNSVNEQLSKEIARLQT